MEKIPLDWAISFVIGGVIVLFAYGLFVMAVITYKKKPLVAFASVIAGGAIGHWLHPLFFALCCQYFSMNPSLVGHLAIIMGITISFIACVIAVQRAITKTM